MKALDFIIFPILLALMIMVNSSRGDTIYVKPMYVKTVDGGYINIQWVTRIRTKQGAVCTMRGGCDELTKDSMEKL